MTVYILDRFEETLAVLENEAGETQAVPREALPAEAKEGDALRYEAGVYTVDSQETESRREQTLSLLRRLRERR